MKTLIRALLALLLIASPAPAAMDFAGTTSDRATVTNGAVLEVTQPPFTMCCWGKSDSDSAVQAMIALSRGSTNFEMQRLFFAGSSAGDPVGATSHVAGVCTQNTVTTTGYTVGQWHHACYKAANIENRTALIDGGSSATGTTQCGSSNMNEWSVGGLTNAGTPANPFDGSLAECGVWDRVLSTNEITSLQVSAPSCIKGGLRHYWPMLNDSTPIPDKAGQSKAHLTMSGTVTPSQHPPIRFYCGGR